MIWKDPVYRTRTTKEWLDQDTGFQTGMVERVSEIMSGMEPPRFQEKYLKGVLMRVQDGADTQERIAKILASLACHTDAAISLMSLEVPLMTTWKRDHPSTGQPIDLTMEMVDVVVITDLDKIKPHDEPLLDLMIARRARPPARVTVIVLPKTNIPALSMTMSMFGERISDQW